MGKHKKNKPTPPQPNEAQTDSEVNPHSQEESEKWFEENKIGDNEFKEKEKIVENLEDMPLPPGDIDPIEIRPEREENESAEDHMQKLKEQGKTLVEPVKKDRISFSEMLRNRRKSTKRN